MSVRLRYYICTEFLKTSNYYAFAFDECAAVSRKEKERGGEGVNGDKEGNRCHLIWSPMKQFLYLALPGLLGGSLARR